VTETRVKCASIKGRQAFQEIFKVRGEMRAFEKNGTNGIGGSIERDVEGRK
jgi:hypothetical protein